MPRKSFGPIALALIAALLAGCSGADTGGFADSGNGSGGKHVARFVQQPWSDLVVETKIATQVLDRLGYQTSAQEVSVPLAGQALSTGQADAYLGNWWPSQEPVFGKLLGDKKVEVAGTLLTGTEYAPAVPGYVTDKLRVRSLADLDKHADAFGREILGIEPGTPGNKLISDAIAKNAYGLGDWKVVQSSTEAMLTEVTRRAAKQQPVVFLGWSPHWMVPEFKLNFLDDPKRVWPGAGEIRVLTRQSLATDDPNLYRFLSQIRVEADTASQWISSVDKEKKPAETVAQDWIRAHPDVLRTWLNGVTSADGKPAADVVIGKG
ncbi:glycine betaine/proline transport system substrate-binding protein [Nonomuraea polychroma]|uniref:Glycine betaine/proline transport system substrate-binding protein n=1 Tax=Nonomuraea polychroma TaxID=46176 RepID=A0A438LZJ5_9ACTN|nr:ABC transporter substrate-binding protein [Nonomuraea polychroma]RVX38969.1 glycine betaine/proline transport system substrate-binding protein [Nonomuraea polychroma]